MLRAIDLFGYLYRITDYMSAAMERNMLPRLSDAVKGLAVGPLLLSAHCAQAQDGVTLYGVLDEFAQYVNTGNGYTAALSSGGQWGSRFGLKGSEEIGGGQKINFDLENGFNANDGTLADAGSLFNRQAWVGVSGGWGQVRWASEFPAVLRPEWTGRVWRGDPGVGHG